ncbi:MAG: NAD-dependent epimerase/dehydratase family protein [Patescibacteria group bacterium]|jgi:UDP-glucose 4-epimerase
MAKKIQRALVTGGAGFIGSHIVDALIQRRIKTFVVDDLSTGSQKNVNPNAQFFKMDITSPLLPKLIEKIKPDVIFHLAAQIDVRHSVKDPLNDAKINLLGSLALAEAAVKYGVKKIIFSSSGGAMYSDSIRPPYSEKTVEQPLSPYAISKRATEMYLNFEHAVRGLHCVVLRYANVYGPRQRSDGEAGVVAIFTERMLAGRPITINGAGTQSRDFVFVEDIVRANMLALTKNVHGIFNLGTGKEVNINQIFRKLKKITNSDLPERHGPPGPGEVFRSALDSRKAAKELAWRPQVRIDDGLQKTVEWFKQKGR